MASNTENAVVKVDAASSQLCVPSCMVRITGWAQSSWVPKSTCTVIPHTCSVVQLAAFLLPVRRSLDILQSIGRRARGKSKAPGLIVAVARKTPPSGRPSVVHRIQGILSGYVTVLSRLRRNLFAYISTMAAPKVDEPMLLEAGQDNSSHHFAGTETEQSGIETTSCKGSVTPLADQVAEMDDGATRRRSLSASATATAPVADSPPTYVDDGDGDVVLENVSLSYGKNQVLKKLNLRIRQGEGTALIGASGTG